MNAAKAVRNVGKKGLNVAKDSVVQIQSIPHVVVSAVIVLLLIVYSAVVVNYVPFKFLAFFENIIVKIVVLVVIAFVGLYCPAIALFLAIALIVTLQMAQKKRMTGDVTTEKMTPQAAMNNSDDTMMKKDKHGSTMKHGKVSMKHGKMMESMEDYLDPALMDGTDDDVNNQDQPMPSETFESMSNMGSDLPLGYNNDSSCIGSCGGNMGNPAISSQCGAVKTWNNQMSAQGLGTDIPGIQPSVGYPVA